MVGTKSRFVDALRVYSDCVTLYTLGDGQCVGDSALNCDWLRNRPTNYYRNIDYEHNANDFVGGVIKSQHLG